MKVLVADPISDVGINIIRTRAEVDVQTGLKADELKAIIYEYDGLVVRSQTQVTVDIIREAKKLLVIGRAGVGVDNIDVEEATNAGIIVVNAPTGNTISATEHTIALMLSLARHIPQASAKLKSGQWKRSDFMGTELKGKTLGIIGLGNIGTEVAKRALAFEMKLLGYDPFVTNEHARKIQVALVPLEQLLKEADFITLHVPMTSSTRSMIGAKQLAMLKPTARIINTARGGLIEEKALAQAAKEKKLAGAAIDVFPKEPVTEGPLFEVDNIIVTPHLGASTTEAQDLAASDVAYQIVSVLDGQPVKYCVNAPLIPPDVAPVLAPFMKVAVMVGKLASQLMEGQVNSLLIKYEGEVSRYETNAIKAAVLGGLLENISEERVNIVNAGLVASRRGISVLEQKETSCENYSSLLTVEVTTTSGTTITAGTLLRGESHIVRVDNYWIDFLPSGFHSLFIDHIDRPGLIGTVGKATGDADINISAMYVRRLKPRGPALMILTVDDRLPDEGVQAISSIPDVISVKQVKL
jgi:D-3-phosphoglycerate dehydrogenase / 2-oxoglutarate reductase